MRNVAFLKSALIVLCVLVFIPLTLLAQQAEECHDSTINFDGVNDYVIASAATTNTYTIEAWIKVKEVKNSSVIVGTDGSGPTLDWSHQVRIISGKFQHYLYDGGQKTVTGTTLIIADQWYHVAISAIRNGAMRLYVNGVEEGTSINVGTPWSLGNQFRFGSNSMGYGYFKGEIEEVRYWSTALNAAEIQAWRNEVVTPVHPRYASLRNYWKMEERSGLFTADSKGTSSGTLTNMNPDGSRLLSTSPVSCGINRATQTITFSEIPDKNYGDAPFILIAESSSGLPVNFSIVSGHASVSGQLLTITGAGIVTVQAVQPGSIDYRASDTIQRSFCAGIASLSPIAGVAKSCNNQQETYKVTNINGAQYTWQISGGGSITSSGNSATVNWTAMGTHTLSVTAIANCGTASTASILAVQVDSAASPGTVSNMIPADGSTNLKLPVTLSWAPAANAVKYDLYLWSESETRPSTPYISNTADISIPVGSGLQNNAFYKWQVVSKNNCLSSDGPVQSFSVNNTVNLPDLTMQSIQHPGTATTGNQITVSWTVKNIGAGSTNAAQWTDYVYLSTDLDLREGDDILLGKFSNQSFLQPGQSYVQTKTLTLPRRFTGSYYLFVITDNIDAPCRSEALCDTAYTNRGSHNYGIGEANESNNYKFGLLTIDYGELPDLRITSLGVPGVVFGGNTINVSYKVTNAGTASAIGTAVHPCPQRGWYDRVFISADSIFNRNKSFEYHSGGFFRDLNRCIDSSRASNLDFLAPDSSYSRIHTVEIPHNYAGTYYIYVITNGYDEVFEGPYDANNIRRSDPITVNLNPPADLLISSIQAPSTALSGQKFNIKWTVSNEGANAPKEQVWKDSIFLSSVNVFDRTKIVKSAAVSHFNGSQLKPGDTYDSGTDLTLPNGQTGDFYIFVKTDAANQVFEYNNEQNNLLLLNHPVVVTPSAVVDLIVKDIQAPDTVKAGNPFDLAWTIKNIGQGATQQGFADYIYCSTDSSLSAGSIYKIGSYEHQNVLSPGQEEAITKSFTVPVHFGKRKIYFFVFTDATNVVYEHAVEDNNRLSSAAANSSGSTYVLPVDVVVKPIILKPDLVTSNFTSPSSGASGKAISVSWEVLNQGEGNTLTNNWTDAVYLSNDTILNGGDQPLLESHYMPGLKAGEKYSRTANLELPLESSGDKYLVFFTDANNQVKNDSIAANNKQHRAINITASPVADLIITQMSDPPVPLYAGSQFMLHYTVVNQGQGEASVSEWYEATYFSTSPQIETGGRAGSKRHIGILAPSATYNDSILVTVPSYFTGNYYLVLRTDNRDDVYEGLSGGANNIFNKIASVQPLSSSPKSDLIVSSLLLPKNAMLGQSISADYSIKNIGASPAIGNLTNAFYLSSNKMFEGDADRLINSKRINSVVINAGDSIASKFQGTVVVPTMGNYFGIARTNILGTVNEGNVDNNTKPTDSTMFVDALELVLEVPRQDLLKKDSVKYYKIIVEANKDLQVTLTSTLNNQAGNNTLYIAYGRVPTPIDFDAVHINETSLNQQVLISSTKAGIYYVRVESNDINVTQPVTLLAKALPFSIVKITPGVVGKDEITGQLYGAGFKDDTKVVLRNNSNSEVAVARVLQFVNSTLLQLKWDLKNVPVGIYTVVAINASGEEVQLADGLKVEVSSGYVLDFIPLLPNQVRKNQSGLFTFKAKNIGNIDIPVVHGDLTIPGYSRVREVTVQGNVKKQSQYYPDTTLFKSDDYYIQDNSKVIPFISRNLAPNQEFTISFLASNFSENSFPIRPRVYGYTARELARQQIGRLEIVRQAVYQNPAYFGFDNTDSIVINAADRNTFINGMLSLYYDSKLLTPTEVAGIDAQCPACLLHIDTATAGANVVYTYSPGNSPGLLTAAGDEAFDSGETFLFEINRSHYWPGYAGPLGQAGVNPGWDMMSIAGKLDITATASSPFTFNIASLSYNNRPGILAGWHPAKDTSWPIVVANGGINNFDMGKFIIDATLFQRQNNTYGGYFYLRVKDGVGADTLFLSFKAYVPGVGEDGVPGAPGVAGEPGSPGGQGGPGDATTPPGDGGPGGPGGPGTPGENGGTGGAGGTGGSGGQWQMGGTGGPGGSGGQGGSGAEGGVGGPGGDGGPGAPGNSGGPGGNGGDGGPGGADGDGGTGGEGGDGGTGEPDGPGGSGGDGGDSGGGSGSGGTGGPGGTGGSDGGSGDAGGGSSAPGTPCSQSNGGNKDLCEGFIDILGAGGTDDPYQELEWLAMEHLAGDNCVAGSLVSCVKSGVEGAEAAATEGSWWGPVAGALECGLKIGDCINQGIYGTKDYPGSDIVKDLLKGADCIGSVVDLAKCAAKEVLCTPALEACDPNEIIGPPSYGSAYMVAAKADLSYSIHFENDSLLATTAAQRVVVRQKVHDNLNPLSFRVGDFGFANKTFKIGDAKSSYFTVLNLADSIGINVEVTAGVDVINRELFWVFQSIDPGTGLPPANPLAGFLPVNNIRNAGQGFVNYSIRPLSPVQTGDTITAIASIVFDDNDPIPTNTWINTIDAGNPASEVASLPPTINTTSVPVHWSGMDDVGGSGVSEYALYVSVNGGPFNVHETGIKDTLYTFTGSFNNTYSFFTLAADNVGNKEPMKNGAEATVRLEEGLILPITWLYFQGNQHNKDVLLTWATTREVNNKYFVIERSLNGNNFSEIGIIDAALNGYQTNNYNYTDIGAISLGANVLYYRLKQVDADGRFKYSGVIAIKVVTGGQAIVQAYPNPFTRHITLQTLNVAGTSQTDNVALYSIEGKRLYTRKLTNTAGSTVLLNDLPLLKPGVYLLKTSINGKLYTSKMMRQ